MIQFNIYQNACWFFKSLKLSKKMRLQILDIQYNKKIVIPKCANNKSFMTYISKRYQRDLVQKYNILIYGPMTNKYKKYSND